VNVLVTGSSGYIASHLIPKLVSLGHRVSGLDRVSGDPRQLSRFRFLFEEMFEALKLIQNDQIRL
jgi:nucleoside-diphosphate-sugar epimerase